MAGGFTKPIPSFIEQVVFVHLFLAARVSLNNEEILVTNPLFPTISKVIFYNLRANLYPKASTLI